MTVTPAVMPGAKPIPPRPPVVEEPVEHVVPGGELHVPPDGIVTLPWAPAQLEPTAPTRQPLAGLDRHQHMRRVALELAVRHYHDLECTTDEVLATAKAWNHWIRTGSNPLTPLT